MEPTADLLAALSTTQRQKLESLLSEFDVAWTPEALAVRVRELPADDTEFRRAAVSELVKIDLERQWKSGNCRHLEDYLRRFPELGSEETVAAQLLFAEYQARRLCNQPTPLREFQLRFPRPFSEFRQLVEQAPSSVSWDPPPAAGVDTSRDGETSGTQSEGRGQILALPKEFGRYRILRKLGEGGMGIVYLAHDTELDRQVALKVPKLNGGRDNPLIERFYREARAAANLRHANICPVHDVGEVDGTRYICMAYIEGRPLSAYVRRDGAQPARQVALVVRKLAIALQEAHSHGVIHRDLKPANIMIDQNKEPVIMDFGLARQLDKHQDSRLTGQGSVVGSPAYMSPEQVAGEVDRIGPATDIYSLGVILFELLTGRLPFEGPVTAVLGQIMTQQAPSPCRFCDDLNPRLAGICQRMMARQIENRYGSMRDVADELTGFLKSSAEDGSPAQKEKRETEALFVTVVPQPPRVMDTRRPNEVSGADALAAARRFFPQWKWLLTGVGAALSLLLLGVILSIRTPHGTVTIDVEDPDLTISIDGEEFTIEQLNNPQRLKAGDHRLAVKLGEQRLPLGETVRLATGEYDGQYKLRVEIDGVSLTGDRFTIVKGDASALTIWLTPQRQDLASGAASAQSNDQSSPVTDVIQGDVRTPVGMGADAKRDDVLTERPFQPNDSAGLQGKQRATLTGHTERVLSVVFSPDGSRLASGSTDRTVKVWDITTGQFVETLQIETFHLHGVEFSHDGTTLFTGSSGGYISLWDIQQRRLRRKLEGHRHWVEGIARSPDGNTLASVGRGGALCVWGANDGSLLYSVEAVDKELTRLGMYCVAYSPDGSTLATGADDNLVKIWNAKTGEVLRACAGHTAGVWAVAFLPDGARLVSASKDGTLKLWNVTTGELLRTMTPNTRRVRGIAVTPDGLAIASGHSDSAIRLWDAQTGELRRVLVGHTGEVFCVAFSPDGSLLASGAADNTIRLWDMDATADAANGVGDASHNASGADSGNEVLNDAERRAAQWVLRLGGTVEIVRDVAVQRVDSTGELPSGPFIVTTIALIRCQSPVDLAQLQGMTQLQRINLAGSRIEHGSLQHIESLSTLRELNLFGTETTYADLRHIACLSNLSSLSLGLTALDDECVEYLKRLTKLTFLDLDGTNVTDAGLHSITSLIGLSALGLDHTAITDAGIQNVTGFPKLERLYLSHTSVSDFGMEKICSLTGLQELKLSGTRLSDSGLEHIKQLRKLRLLEMSDTEISDAGLVHVGQLFRLERLWLDNTSVTDEGLQYIAPLHRLCHVQLGNTKISDAGVRQLSEMTEMQILVLNGTQIGDQGLETLQGLVKLIWLEIGHTNVTDAGLVHIRNMDQLTRLVLNETTVTDKGLQNLVTLKNLSELQLMGTKVSDAGLKLIGSMSQLNYLFLNDTMVGDDGLKSLEGLANLRELHLLNTRVTQNGVNRLQSLLPTCHIAGSW